MDVTKLISPISLSPISLSPISLFPISLSPSSLFPRSLSPSSLFLVGSLVVVYCLPPQPLSAQPVKESLQVIRDHWGVPHVFAETDRAAMYGLGYATAEDRAFQMTYSLRIIQGRLAEVIGVQRQLNRNETSVDHDRKMRTFGFYRTAQRRAAELDAETGNLLQAYCDGVNAYFRENADRLHPLFAELELVPEPWTAADCLASWWHFAQFFGTDGTRDLIAGRNPGPAAGRGRPTATPDAESAGPLVRLPDDDSTAVIQRHEVSPEWLDEALRYARERGLLPDPTACSTFGSDQPPPAPKFSHCWVVGAGRTTTGSAVLVSDPQTPVRNPSLLYEFHIQGATFNARGVGVAGCPLMLIGFNQRVAWGMTALGADQADLFLLDTDPDRPGQYRFDGQWKAMQEIQEWIRIKGAPSLDYRVRLTELGPVATPFCFALPGEPEVALKRIPLIDSERETFRAGIAMLRSNNAVEFDRGLAEWEFPSANVIFGDREGAIGYRAVGSFPIRSIYDETQGRAARPGHRSDQDWQELLPHQLAPALLNPASGYLFSANHRVIGDWYPLSLGVSTGSAGDTLRSWRLRELLAQQPQFTPEAVLAIHFDAVNPARREIVRLGLHLRDQQRASLPAEAERALEQLEPWYFRGAEADLKQPGSALALELNTFFRFVNTDLTQVYGGGESGLAYFLKTVGSRLQQDPQAVLTELEQEFIAQSLAQAWGSAVRKYGPQPQDWETLALQTRQPDYGSRLGYFESLHGFPALDPRAALTLPELTRLDGGTLGCQTSQAYTQWVPLHDPDQSMSILPPGHSERLDHKSRLATWELWGDSRLHPAPLSKEKIQAIASSEQTIWLEEGSDQ